MLLKNLRKKYFNNRKWLSRFQVLLLLQMMRLRIQKTKIQIAKNTCNLRVQQLRKQEPTMSLKSKRRLQIWRNKQLTKKSKTRLKRNKRWLMLRLIMKMNLRFRNQRTIQLRKRKKLKTLMQMHKSKGMKLVLPRKRRKGFKMKQRPLKQKEMPNLERKLPQLKRKD